MGVAGATVRLGRRFGQVREVVGEGEGEMVESERL